MGRRISDIGFCLQESLLVYLKCVEFTLAGLCKVIEGMVVVLRLLNLSWSIHIQSEKHID